MQMIYMRIKCPFDLICHLTSLFEAYVDEMHSMFPEDRILLLTNPHLVGKFAGSPLENGGGTTKKKRKEKKKRQAMEPMKLMKLFSLLNFYFV